MKYEFLAIALVIIFVVSVGARQTAKPDNTTATPITVPRYEYCQYYAAYFEDDLMDNFGRQGWELVSFNTIGERQINANFVGAKEYVATFKRQVGSGLKNCAETRKNK
jgi:Domain of unknown function (DUF4177)